MVEKLKRELTENGSLVFTGALFLLGIILGLVSYINTLETDALSKRIDTLSARVDRGEQSSGTIVERMRSVEDAAQHLAGDLSRIGKNIDSLNDKLDRLLSLPRR